MGGRVAQKKRRPIKEIYCVYIVYIYIVYIIYIYGLEDIFSRSFVGACWRSVSKLLELPRRPWVVCFPHWPGGYQFVPLLV